MGAGRYDLKLDQSCTFSRLVTLERPAGTPVNLTGCEPRATIAWLYGPTRQEITEITAEIYGTATNGQVSLILTPGDVDLIATPRNADVFSRLVKIGYWDLLVENADGTIDAWLEGDVFLNRRASS